MNFNPRELYTPGYLIRVFIYNTLIALGLTLVSILVTKAFIFSSLISNFVFSHFIGWSLAIPLQFITKNKEHWNPYQISGLVFLTLLLGGVFGSMSAWLLMYKIFYPQIPHWPPLTALLANLVMAFFFGLLAFIYFNVRNNLEKTILELKQKELEEVKLKQLQKSAELDALRARIDPHFLFNTFNSIASLIRINPELAEQMVEKLSGLFRFSLRSSDRKFVELEEELNIVRNYLEIEALRFGKRLSFEINCKTDLQSAQLPPLLIQPLVENSIKHGIQKMKNGGKIIVTCSRNEDRLQLSVFDNGPGFEEFSVQHGYGLRSVKERLGLLYHEDYDFKIKNEQGANIIIEIPFHQEQKNGL